jgi:soluble lytic murein transglycosylase
LQGAYKTLPQPDGDFAMGLAYEALGEKAQAALSYERVYYEYPNTDLAAQSSTAIDRLRPALGKDFPNAPGTEQLDRGQKWLDARQYLKARQEYTALSDRLEGAAKDAAKVGIGKSDYLANDAPAAYRYLKALHVTDKDADAERLYYLTEAARKTDNDAEMMDAVRNLEEHYPKSPWRLKAMIAAGNSYLVTNQPGKATPLFRAAAEIFPDDNSAAYAHWKVAWDAYLAEKPERTTLMREQVERYPDDTRASTALYFLGRIAEATSKHSEARAYYDRLNEEFPHYFYAVLARQRVQGKVADAMPDTDAVMWLEDVDWPSRRDLSATEPNAATARRIDRARLLVSAGLPDLAESELRFGSKQSTEQPQLLAMELAQNADTAFRALRVMKSFSADYLSLPLEKAPEKFWEMLFPLPYKDEVFGNARERGIDPWDVAALIRQESEFNPTAKSPANARGLMQLEPSTGRMLGRQQGMSVPTSLLFSPAVSIRLGTEYLKQQLKSWDGDWFRTLAAYNAGPGRVHQWLAGANFREPVEFLESIPFNETREYIQAVVRNADIYREIYSKWKVPAQTTVKTPPVQIAKLVKPEAAASPRKVATSSAKKSASAKKTIAKKTVSAKATPE